jgi:type II secretory pathway component GspD/PulD (secretin)
LRNFLFGFLRWRRLNGKESMTDARTLLAEYVRNRSEAAFEELVRRYTDLVYSTAVRLVAGDAHRANLSTASPQSPVAAQSVASGNADPAVTTRVFMVDAGVLGRLVQPSSGQTGDSFQESFQQLLQSQGIGANHKVTWVPDERTGALVVSATKSDHELIEKLISNLSTNQ